MDAAPNVLTVTVTQAKGLLGADTTLLGGSSSDPYAIIEIRHVDGKPLGPTQKTPVKKQTRSPSWGA